MKRVLQRRKCCSYYIITIQSLKKLTAEEPASDEESVDNIPEDKLVDDKVLADDNEADNEEAEQASKMPTVVPYLFTYVAKDGTQWVKVMLEPDGPM
ncbi:hypothetical protein ILUMI_20525 [Ignelater luminosus]|uniref:Uncharacterized protein n=1 Tax=Ignelater luminosus TaxID=2038154 RepID=A0A8K0CI15_IGNLU|nr:hypothetical protein ILUMI_20525 [Ignelater luminosus]